MYYGLPFIAGYLYLAYWMFVIPLLLSHGFIKIIFEDDVLVKM